MGMAGNVAFAVLAVLAAVAGVALLFGSWRKRIPRRNLVVPAGWALLVLSGGFWVAGTGPEFGITLVLLGTPAVAWAFVVANREYRERRERRVTPPPKVACKRPLSHHATLFVLVVPLAAAASALVSVALSLALPVSEINAMVAVLVVMPVLWGCAAYWAVADSRVLRPATAMLLVAAASAVIIYV